MNKRIIILISVAIILVGSAIIFLPRQKVDAPIGGTSLLNDEEKPSEKAERCGIQNCHGLDVVCGMDAPELCTMEYQFGDSCRKFARCQVQEGECKLVVNAKFEECKDCIASCKKSFSEEDMKLWDCETDCHKKINGTETPVLE